ncbi:MAG TPA: S8 family serine peptidase [Ferruginibacter sp.]|nr:S8 family serine peptidase [Ferruginibacter sp.]
MKKGCLYFLVSFLLTGLLQAQTNDIPVRFREGNFITGNNVQRQSFQPGNLQSSLFNNEYYVLVQFASLPSAETKRSLNASGVQLLNYIPGNAYFASISSRFDFSSAARYSIISINPVPPLYKIDRNVLSYRENKDDVFAVSYYAPASRSMVIMELQKAGADVLTTKFSDTHAFFVKANPSVVNELASLPFVSYISLQSLTDKPLNYKSTGMHGVRSLLSSSGRNLGGRGVVVGIGDNSELQTGHLDFTNRVISRVSFPISFHGIHVTGTVAGAGLLNPKYNGMAPRATIVGQYLSDIITNAPTYVTDFNMIATNNSYTAADDSCAGSGVYDVISNYTDDQMKTYEQLLHVVSAGNDGTYTCSPFPLSFATIKSGYQCAKNVLTVGAMDSVYSIANFSSRGPVQDGRIKPEIVADGVNVLSTRHNNTYGTNSGTSMSGPVVAGTATVLNEQYRKLHGNAIPKASLIKALLCNNAEDLGNPGPDFTFGFGMLNARKAVEAMEANQYFISNTTPSTNTIAVPGGVRRLKVMLYWADPAAAANAANTLVNDLDLTVTAPGPVTHLPLVLDATPGGVTINAAEGADHVNNIEQVVIDNPAAGNYDLNVTAFNVPLGPQEYVLTYSFEINGVTVEYPFGAETLVPGEIETIRWTAYGDETNTFTLEYFDGTSWNLINNNIAATARHYYWTVPATLSNNYRIRVSRNSSAYTDQSDYDFAVMGQPVLNNPTVPCEGYVLLDWPAVTGATSYDIWQQKGDSMAIIANTPSGTLNYLVQGLNSSTGYWFAVSARNGAVNGRRSVAKTITPTTGACSLSNFDNNFKAVSISAPVSGRQLTSSALTATEQVRFTIKNLDNAASSGSYDLYYQVNGGTPVMESSSTVVNSLTTRLYTFATTANLSATGIYVIKAWVKRPGDSQPLDDTVSVTIKNLPNPLLTLPQTDGFETALAKEYNANTVGLDSIDKVDFKTNTVRGRARTFVNTGFAYSGNRAITLDQFVYNSALTTDSMLMTYNLNNYTSGNQLRLDFYYKNHGQDNNPNNKVWIRGSDTKPWVLAYDLVANQAALGQWKHAVINVNDVLDTVLPAQPISTSFQVKFGEQGNTSANNVNIIIDQDDGYTFDDVTVKEATNDIGILNIVSPSITGCGLSGAQPVSVQVKNYTATTFTNVPVYYRVNGGASVIETIASLPPGTYTHTFAAPENLTINTDYNFDFWVNEPTDSYRLNDSLLNYSFHTSQVISSFPYLEGFESNDGGWYSKGSNNSWQWGTPSKTTINKAANGTKAWVTSLSGHYKNNELSYLYSPCFNLSGMTQPVLSFSHIFEIEDGTPADYNWIEYSTNGGVTWTRLGSNGVGTNWYNDPTLKNQWRPSLTTWHVASTDIPTTGSNVRFRFVMSSDMGINYEGVGIDDIHVFDKALIYDATPTVTGLTQNVSGSSWVHFTSAGKRVASINANGFDLGSTTVDVYPYTGAVRTQNNQYYLDRNIVIRPTLAPGGYVSVRFYFTDAEAKNLLNASGCGGCSKPRDPYELGVTKYSGPAIQENGTLADNSSGAYIYILPGNTEIIPYDNGYYAEYPVNSFSEFWLNNGGTNANEPLPVNLLSFEAAKQNNKALLSWITSGEMNLREFIVERSTDGNRYTSIGMVPAKNTAGNNYYSLNDLQPIDGLNYYRLQMIDRDGIYRYSPIRKLNFSSAGEDVMIYPNPVTGSRVFIASSGNTTGAILYDAAGKLIRQFSLQGRNNTLNLSGIAKGVYQLKVFTGNDTRIARILIQ